MSYHYNNNYTITNILWEHIKVKNEHFNINCRIHYFTEISCQIITSEGNCSLIEVMSMARVSLNPCNMK